MELLAPRTDLGQRAEVIEMTTEATAESVRATAQGRNVLPRKRAVALTAFLACLSFLAITGNAILTFFQNLTENEKFWNNMAAIKNCTCSPN